MQQFNHTSTDFNIHTTVEIGRQLMTVTVGELAKANFLYDDLQGVLRDIPDPAVLATILDFNGAKAWEVYRDAETTLNNMREFFKDSDVPELAEFLEENLDRFTLAAEKVGLSALWESSLREELYVCAARKGKLKTSRQEKNFEALIAKAHPLRLSKTRHPLATHFVSNVWPQMHHKIRSAMPGASVRNVDF